MSFAELRQEHQNALKREKGKILPFENFKLKVESTEKLFQTKKEETEVPLYSNDGERRIYITFWIFYSLSLLRKNELKWLTKRKLICRRTVFCTNGQNFLILFQLLIPMTIITRKLPN